VSYRDSIGQKMRNHYEGVWRAGDAWSLETSEFEQRRYEQQLALVESRQYESVLEIGCGSGMFTPLLAGVAKRVVALDIAEAAVERARKRSFPDGAGAVEYVVANVMEYDLQARSPWDLIVLSETMYCLGWLYSFFDIAWFAEQLLAATRDHGRLLLTNAFGHEHDYLLQPGIIRTYRDLFLNVGYELEHELVFQDVKDGVAFEILMSLFAKPSR
jgi:SAM-dependent methyltransferase